MTLGLMSVDSYLRIFSYVFGFMDREIAGMKIQKSHRLVSKNTASFLTGDLQKQSFDTAFARIITAAENKATRVDLSRCGLNQIDGPITMRILFEQIPRGSTELSLRSNGLGLTKRMLLITIESLKFIPTNISYLDLSDNGFNQYDSAKLEQLFFNLPSTVQWVSLRQENPLSPMTQIALRDWPQSFHNLTSGSTNIMHQARAILDDYTQANSPLWRFFYGYWNRHHIAEIVNLVRHIDRGLITNITDLLGELELIDKSNELGALAKSIHFLTTKSLHTPQDDDSVDLENSIELRVIKKY